MLTYKILQVVGFAAGGLITALICNILLLRFAHSLGIRNKNDVVIRWSNESKPSLGGVSFFVVFMFASICFSILFDEVNIFQNKQFVGLFAGSALAFAMGLADDAYNTRPFLKLTVQILCGVLLVLTDTTIHLFHEPIIDSIFTVLWVVVIMNSLNMLDNMDGITGTTVFFILLSCLISGWMVFEFNTNIWTLLNVAVIGGVVGFLTMNVHPSKLFMGDAGSQFIGFFVAFYGVRFLWGVSADTASPSWLGLCIALVAFTPAAVDTLTVVINRLKKGRSPLVGGKDHTTHHLVYSGMNDFKVWLVFLLVGFLSFVLALAMVNLVMVKTYLPVIFFPVYTVFVFILLYRNTIKYKEPESRS